MPHPAVRVSRFVSVSVCSNSIRTICSRSNSFRHFVSSIILKIALAAADLVLGSVLCRSFKIGRIRCSRIAASSGSDGGLTGLPAGLSLFRALSLALGFDLPILPGRGLWMRPCALHLYWEENNVFGGEFSECGSVITIMPHISGLNGSITHN
jgi:hypothetical protein